MLCAEILGSQLLRPLCGGKDPCILGDLPGIWPCSSQYEPTPRRKRSRRGPRESAWESRRQSPGAGFLDASGCSLCRQQLLGAQSLGRRANACVPLQPFQPLIPEVTDSEVERRGIEMEKARGTEGKKNRGRGKRQGDRRGERARESQFSPI